MLEKIYEGSWHVFLQKMFGLCNSLRAARRYLCVFLATSLYVCTVHGTHTLVHTCSDIFACYVHVLFRAINTVEEFPPETNRYKLHYCHQLYSFGILNTLDGSCGAFSLLLNIRETKRNAFTHYMKIQTQSVDETYIHYNGLMAIVHRTARISRYFAWKTKRNDRRGDITLNEALIVDVARFIVCTQF